MAAPGSTARTPSSVPVRPTPSARRFGGVDEAAILRRVVSMCGHLSALASQNTELADVVALLADGAAAGVVVLDRRLDVLARAGVGDRDVVSALRDQAGVTGLRTVLAAAARNRRALTVPGTAGAGSATIVAPVSVGEDVAGYLVTTTPCPSAVPASGVPGGELTEDMRLLVTEHAAMVCGVVLGRELVVTAAAGRARQELVEGLLLARDRDDPEIDRWAQHLGFEPGRGYCAVAIGASGDRAPVVFGTVEAAAARLVPDAIVATRTDEVVALVPAPQGGGSPVDAARALAAGCLAATAGRMGMRTPVAAGVGNPCTSAAEIARSYAEARHALLAGERLGGTGSVTAFADLGIHRLLLRVPDVADLRGFAEEVVGALIAEERNGGMEYLATLSAYFEHNNSPRRAAEKLHVHPNTVSYRIRRIEEITGLSLDVRRDRLMAEVAVEILDALGGRR
ncbi:MAG: helix-turn-helix domain-containing protein [Pseudonocardia sp.]|uniref:PucR family transcriptional regulator n=1 Tax=unclassified Pseudonocardia TaxID=2619320 RepID=UPI000AEB758C|nr:MULTISPECIES: helix-turn-helix domain-containing protein [unclassified Pseudonocardia]MBN9110409.1 helix-turn-helix domain-containing protein [Pseudonocardia sp.]